VAKSKDNKDEEVIDNWKVAREGKDRGCTDMKEYKGCTHLFSSMIMMSEFYLAHTTCAESLGEGVLSEDTIGNARFGRVEAALGVL
jgi:hypothetical protein